MSTIFTPSRRKAEFAVKLRREMTRAEEILWEYLSKQSINRCRLICPWKSQVVIAGWIVDFYNERRLLALEIDGSIHGTPEQKRKDAVKDQVLASRGIRVIRIPNEIVCRKAESIAKQLSVKQPVKFVLDLSC